MQTKIVTIVVIGGVLALSAPVERAQALSPINPGAANTVQDESRMTTEIHWHHHWHHHHWHHWHHRHWRHW